MQKLQDSVFSIVKTTNLSPAVFSYLQPTEDFTDKTPLGGILSDTKHGWLALGPKFCVIDLRTGLKVAERTFGTTLSNFRTTVTCVVELPTSLTNNSTQLLISLECEDIAGMICVFHVNGSQILRCIQTEVVVTELAVCEGFPDGPFTCFDGAVMAGTKSGEIFIFDLNRSSLIQALKDITQGYGHLIRSEENSSNITFLPLNAVQQIESQRDLTLENDDHIAVLLNENSIVDGQTYIFRNPDGTVRMKAKRDHVQVTVIQYIPQLGSLAVGFNFGAFQIWNLLNMDLEFTSQVNVECLPVTHFGFQEPCDDPRAFCYLWVVFSVLDRFEEEEFPFAVMYSLTYQGKRMLSDTKCLYQEFLTAAIRFQVELNTIEEAPELVGGRCVSCHTYSVNSMLAGEGEESMLNICQLVWQCWGENANASSQYGMLLFDLDQWYKDQMPATYPLQSSAFMSACVCPELARGATATLDVRLAPCSVSVYCAASRLEEHFYPNSLRYDCICLNTSEACVLSTPGIQRQIINSLEEVGPTALLNPSRLYHACVQTGLVPLYVDSSPTGDQEEQRRYLLSVALEARLSRFLKRCAHDWATGSHAAAGCTLTFLVDWCWKRAIELKENARELTAPLFTSSALPDRNVVRCLEHCVQQLTQLTGLLDAVLTKCCNLVVPDALSEMEEKFKGIGTVSLYFQVVQWFLLVGLLPERQDASGALPYPAQLLQATYTKRYYKEKFKGIGTVSLYFQVVQWFLLVGLLPERQDASGALPYPAQLLQATYTKRYYKEKFKGIGTVSLYFQVVQWFLLVGLLPERQDASGALPYPAQLLQATYTKRYYKEKFKGIGTVSLYFQVVQWFLLVGLLPERQDASGALPYPAQLLQATYTKRYYKEKFKGIGTVSLYFQVVQWFLLVGLLPERQDASGALPYPAQLLQATYTKRYYKEKFKGIGTVSLYFQVVQWFLLVGLLPERQDASGALPYPAQLLQATYTKRYYKEKFKGIGTVSLYFQVVQWFLLVGLLPERQDASGALPYPAQLLQATYTKRRAKLHRLQEHAEGDESAASRSCPLLYIDQLIEEEFGGDRIHQMWIRGGSETNGLYPPPSLYSLLRLYLLPDIAEEHKHSLVLYLLVDYSMIYDEVRYEAVIRRLMQFPTMFGLSNTAIKATQAFWHLDHRDFDFALDQLQCLTGASLSVWQHCVVVWALLLQGKSQAALQYLHIVENDRVGDWQSCCQLYLSRGLVFQALHVARCCHHAAATQTHRANVLNLFYQSCRNTGQLSKLLQATLMPFEEEVFIKYLENCNEPQTSDILVMYYLQQARYLEADQYNKRIKQSKPHKSVTASLESLADTMDRDSARDTLVEVMCNSLPAITNTVAHSLCLADWEPHVVAPKPMSVFVQAKSPKNTFVYKSSFIQDSIENASETWMNKPKARKGLKRALNIEETPFLCTPKLSKTKSIFGVEETGSTPPKRARLDLSGAARTPRSNTAANISQQLSALLDMPDTHSPHFPYERSGAGTPHSILKIRNDASRSMAASPCGSRYHSDSDDDILDTASNHTHYSDSTNKHLRFTIPTASESGSTPSPVPRATETDTHKPPPAERDVDISSDSFVTTHSHTLNEPNLLESPPKKVATEEKVQSRKSYKDSVRGRRSLSVSANSSLSDDPNTSIESIADIPYTLINVRYSHEARRSYTKQTDSAESANEDKASYVQMLKEDICQMEVPKSPKGRKSIRSTGQSTPLRARSRSATPERADSPVAITTPLRTVRSTRSRSRTPDISPRSSPLTTIPEQPRQEVDSEPHAHTTLLSVHRAHRSRSRTPERIEKVVESPRLEAITESPKSEDSLPDPRARRNLRSRSRTPEIEQQKTVTEVTSPRTLRSRAKTPEKLMSPKKEAPKSTKKPLSRLVLEANALAASKNLEKQLESKEENSESIIECTPMKTLKPVSSLLDVTISPIVSKSVLHSSNDSVLSETVTKENKTAEDVTFEMKSLPAFTMNETKFGKSVLHSYESSVEEASHKESQTEANVSVSKAEQKSLPAFTLNESYFGKSVLHSYQSSTGDASSVHEEKTTEHHTELKISQVSTSFNITDINKSVLGSVDTSQSESQVVKDDAKNMSSLMTDDSEVDDWKKEQGQDVIQKEKEKIVEIEREINEFEHDMSEEDHNSSENSDDSDEDDEEDDACRQEEEEEVEEEYVPHENEVQEEQSSIIINEDEDSDSSSSEDEYNSEDEDIISILDTDESSHNVQIDAVLDREFVQMDNENTNEDSNDNKEASNDAAINAIQDSGEGSVDPLNQARMSVLTDDNSIRTDSIADSSKIQTEDININVGTEENTRETGEISTNPLDQGQISILTDDNSVHSDRSEGKLNYSNEDNDTLCSLNKPKVPLDTEMNPNKSTFEIQVIVEAENVVECTPECPIPTLETKETSEQTDLPQSDVVDATATTDKIVSAKKETQDTVKLKNLDVEMKDVESKQDSPKASVIAKFSESEDIGTEDVNKPALRSRKRNKSTSSIKSNKGSSSKSDVEAKSVESKSEDTASEDTSRPVLRTKKRTKSTSSNKSNIEETSNLDVNIKSSETESKSEDTASEDVAKPASRTKKRTKSNSSTKSTEQKDTSVEIKTPMTRKRAQSVASNKSATEEQKTPEDTKNLQSGTPNTRRRAKTPTSAESRKILTRRASKELSQSVLDDSLSAVEDTSLTTPKRRSTRSRSKNIDDNASVASGSSVRSSRSKASEDGDSKPQRKPKKSVLAAVKPDLSVIPESAVEDSKNEIIADYSRSRRLTRHQKSLLESWLEPKASPSRRRSAASRSTASNQSRDDDDAEVTHAFDVQPIDRIALLNKGDFEGSPDPSEAQSVSPESIASDASKQRRSRMTRASSEAKSTPKARSIRRKSVDIGESAVGSPLAGSPARGRRASFTRAVEALHTPKRRASVDHKGDAESVSSSPPPSEGEPTPARRARQPADTTAKRSRKLSAVEEHTDTKKK